LVLGVLEEELSTQKAGAYPSHEKKGRENSSPRKRRVGPALAYALKKGIGESSSG